MSRTSKAFIEDILQAIQKISLYIEGITFEVFIENSLIYDAVIRNLEIIGEAVKNIPIEVRTKRSNIDWKKIAGLRDIVSHEYFGIDDEIIWDIIVNKLGNLQDEMKALNETLIE